MSQGLTVFSVQQFKLPEQLLKCKLIKLFVFFHFSLLFVQVELTISKPGAKGEVPVGVIVGSVIGGLVLLAVAVALLWKVIFGFTSVDTFKIFYILLPVIYYKLYNTQTPGPRIFHIHPTQ